MATSSLVDWQQKQIQVSVGLASSFEFSRVPMRRLPKYDCLFTFAGVWRQPNLKYWHRTRSNGKANEAERFSFKLDSSDTDKAEAKKKQKKKKRSLFYTLAVDPNAEALQYPATFSSKMEVWFFSFFWREAFLRVCLCNRDVFFVLEFGCPNASSFFSLL
jgi:hypothetical protein